MYENTNTYHYRTENESGYQNAYPAGGAGNRQEKEPKRKMGTGKKIAVGICCGLVFGIFAGLGFQAVDMAADVLKASVNLEILPEAADQTQEIQAAEAPAVQQNEEIAALDQTKITQTAVTDVTEVVKEVMPAVVSVHNTYVSTMSYFGQQYSSEGASTGSGIIVGQNDTQLMLVSNYHVVEEADELMVQFVDGSQVQAQIKGTDRDKDLAVLTVQLSDIGQETREAIAVANLGDSDALTVGEPVIAIGNALGYGQSVTTGVVSALNRPIALSSTGERMTVDSETNTFIQTDAAINFGNSGGALLNISGEVIGINSNKIGGSAVEGIGYAIPISDAKPIIEELMTKDKVEEENKGYLGITGIDVVAEYVQVYGLPAGVYISSVTEGSGADQAGLIKGDIIAALNGKEITSMEKLKEELSYYEAGAVVELTIMQGSPTGYQAKIVEVTLGSSVQ